MTAKKKKLIKGLVAVALIAIIGIGATFAYLTMTTNTATNNFAGTTKNINGNLTEDKWNQTKANSYQPGDVLAKNPVVTLGDSENAYVAMSIDYYGNGATYDSKSGAVEGKKISQDAFKQFASIDDLNSKDYKLIAKSTDGSELYMYNAELAAKQATNPLFNSITVNAGIKTLTTTEASTASYYTFEDTNANGVYDKGVDGAPVLVKTDTITDTNTVYVDANGNYVASATLPTFIMNVKGYGVQSANTTDANRISELIKEANLGRTGNDVFVAV